MNIETIEGKRPKFTHVFMALAERREQILDDQLLSECCERSTLFALDSDNMGRCSSCKENAQFKTLTLMEI